MTIPQAHQVRKIVGWITAALLFAALACLADALKAGFKDGEREFQAMPGTVLPVVAQLPFGATTIEEMRIHGGDESVKLSPEGLFTGFWLGGSMWRGSITVSGEAEPGVRILTVDGPPLATPSRPIPPLTFQVTVHANAQAMRLAAASFITRYSGFNPFAASLFCVVSALPGAGVIFLLSRRIEQQLALEGIALVYMVKKTEEGQIITFSLGSRQGFSPGMAVSLVGPAGHTVGEAQVTASTPEDATARIVSGSCDIGCMVIHSPGETSPQGG